MLSPKKIIFFEKLSTQKFNWVIGEIELRFIQSIVHPGEMVGCMAA